MATLRNPSGNKIQVDDSRVDTLVKQGFVLLDKDGKEVQTPVVGAEDLQKQLDLVNKENAGLKDNLVKAGAQIKALETERNDSRKELDAVKKQLEDLKIQIANQSAPITPGAVDTAQDTTAPEATAKKK